MHYHFNINISMKRTSINYDIDKVLDHLGPLEQDYLKI